MKLPRPVLLAVVAVLALTAGLLTAHGWRQIQSPPAISGTLLPAPRPIPEFSLLTAAGQPFTNADLQGHWSVFFFGFTHCPDVCPMTLATLNQTARLLAADTPRFVFVTVDPMRDTPDVLGPYVHYFNPAFTGVTGNQAAIAALTQALGIAYTYTPGATPDEYTVDHSAALLLFNPRGELAAVFTPPHKAETLARDLRALQAFYGS